MAGDWLKFEKSTLDKPEVFEMAGILGIDPDAVIGKLLRVWNWFDDQSRDGHASVTVLSLLDRYTGVTGFVSAMKSVGWMVEENGLLFLPNFERHNGTPAKSRALAKTRKQKSRSGHAECHAPSVTETGPEKRREENRREESKKGNRAKFAIPTIQEVDEYAATLDPPFTRTLQWLAHYESNGWKVGKNPMKDWKAAIRTWHASDRDLHTPYTPPLKKLPWE